MNSAAGQSTQLSLDRRRAPRWRVPQKRRFRFKEIGVLFAGITPVLFCDALTLQHRFGPQETRRDRHGGNAVRPQLGRHVER